MPVVETSFKFSEVELRALQLAIDPTRIPGDRPDLRSALARARGAIDKAAARHTAAAPMPGRPDRPEGGLDDACPLTRKKHDTVRLEGKIVCKCGAWRRVSSADPQT